MFSKNTLLLYQQDLQLGPYIFYEMATGDRSGWPKFSIKYFAK